LSISEFRLQARVRERGEGTPRARHHFPLPFLQRASMSFFSTFAVIFAVALPHLGLAHLWGFPLYPTSIPQPLLNLIVLSFVSLLTAEYIKPAVLDLLLPPTSNSTARYGAEWISSVVQWTLFSLLWVALLSEWPVPPRSTRSEQAHAQLIETWMVASGTVAILVFVFLNS
jgi:hypothetical protein